MLPRESVGHRQRVDGPSLTKRRREAAVSNRESKRLIRRKIENATPQKCFGYTGWPSFVLLQLRAILIEPMVRLEIYGGETKAKAEGSIAKINANARKTGQESKTAPPKCVSVRNDPDPLFCVTCRTF
jgi:hypothetical protein